MSALGFAASMGIAGGFDTVEKYSYQDYINKQKLITDQMRREAEFEFQQKTAGARRAMAREDALDAAQTQMDIFDMQAPMRQAQQDERVSFRLDELEKLLPAEIKRALEKEGAMQEFTRAIREKYAEQDRAFAAEQAEANQEVQQKVIAGAREFLLDLGLDEGWVDRATVRMMSDMDPLANTGLARSTSGSGSNVSYKDLGAMQLQQDIRGIRDVMEESLNLRLPDGMATTLSDDNTGSDAREAVRPLVDDFIESVSSLKLPEAKEAIRQMAKMTGPEANAWSPEIKRLETFVNLFDDSKHFKRIMSPSTAEEVIESMQFREANLPAFRIFESGTNASATAVQASEDAEDALAAPGSYGPNYTRNDAITDVRGAAAEAGFNIDDSILQELN
jgi:hypothetical protein